MPNTQKKRRGKNRQGKDLAEKRPSATSCYEDQFTNSCGNSEILSKIYFQVSDSMKNTSLNQTNFGKLQNKVPIFYDFQILHAGSNTIKEI